MGSTAGVEDGGGQKSSTLHVHKAPHPPVLLGEPRFFQGIPGFRSLNSVFRGFTSI